MLATVYEHPGIPVSYLRKFLALGITCHDGECSRSERIQPGLHFEIFDSISFFLSFTPTVPLESSFLPTIKTLGGMFYVSFL